jgi:hypothetical protein
MEKTVYNSAAKPGAIRCGRGGVEIALLGAQYTRAITWVRAWAG